MNINYDELNVQAIKDGYIFNPQTNQYTCMFCDAIFEAGEIYKYGERFFDAFRAVQIHIEQEHENMFYSLLNTENKYNTFTDNQKELLSMFYEGISDNQIAVKLGISPSTVRHQKFTFREKVKQAKMYLAIYELAMEKKESGNDKILPIHNGAKMVDDRYITTEEESEKIISLAFESLSPLKLNIFSKKEKKKLVILRKIAEQFEQGKNYPEKEVNRILREIFEDYATLRRYLIEYGFMDRTNDCKTYWLKK